jgi:hypothetical protein
MDIRELIIDPMLEAAEPLAVMAPRFLAFFGVILVGFIFAYLFKKLIVFVARLLNFDLLSYRIGLTSVLTRIWYDQTPVQILGRAAAWLVLIFHLFLGVSVLHMDTLTELVTKTMAWIPLLGIALLIFCAGYFVSRFVGRAVLISLVNMQYSSANLIAFLARGIVMIFFAAIAMEHVGVGRGIVVATFAIILGGTVLGLAIAFGLGGQEIARDVLERKLRSLEGKTRSSDEISHL